MSAVGSAMLCTMGHEEAELIRTDIMAWLTVEQASELTGYNAEYIRRLIREGRLKAQKFGPVWQVDKRSIISYLKAAQKASEHHPMYSPRRE